jgi:hypothetical protein
MQLEKPRGKEPEKREGKRKAEGTRRGGEEKASRKGERGRRRR